MDLLAIFEKFGLPVSFLIVMIYLFLRSEDRAENVRKEHKEERSEWRESQAKLQKGTNEALRDLTVAITKIESKK